MSTFIGEAALAALKTALTTIGDGSTTWAQSQRPQVFRARHFKQSPPVLPCIMIGRHVENFTDNGTGGSYRQYSVESIVDVDYLFDSSTWVHDTDASKATHDLIKALRDHTLGSTVMSCSIQSITTTIPTDGTDPTCGIHATIRLDYFMSEDDPSAAV